LRHVAPRFANMTWGRRCRVCSHESAGLRIFAEASGTNVQRLDPHGKIPVRSVAVPYLLSTFRQLSSLCGVGRQKPTPSTEVFDSALTLPNVRPPLIELLWRLVHGMPSHLGEIVTPRRKIKSKLARVSHCRGHGFVWQGYRGEPWVRSGSSCGRLSVRQGENGSAAPTTHPTVSELMRKLRYRDPHTNSENRFTDRDAISTIATFGKYQP